MWGLFYGTEGVLEYYGTVSVQEPIPAVSRNPTRTLSDFHVDSLAVHLSLFLLSIWTSRFVCIHYPHIQVEKGHSSAL